MDDAKERALRDALEHALAAEAITMFLTVQRYNRNAAMKATCDFCGRPRRFGEAHPACRTIRDMDFGVRL